MFHPVGSQPPAVYWRRRFAVLATLVLLLVLLVLTVRAITSSATGKPAAAAHHAGSNRSTHHRRSTPSGGGRHRGAAAGSTQSIGPARRHHHRVAPSGAAASSAAATSPAATGAGSAVAASTGAASTGAASTSAPPPPRCTPAQLDVQAAVGQSTYHVGQKPVVMLQVTNTGNTPCVQDLADRQIVLKIYNGESRVWGSHDCEVQPGTADRVLAVGHPVRVSMTWSGMTSQPGCSGTRHQAGAGTYTLYPYLAGHQGKATQFSIV